MAINGTEMAPSAVEHIQFGAVFRSNQNIPCR
jgi:hypothetical protein